MRYVALFDEFAAAQRSRGNSLNTILYYQYCLKTYTDYIQYREDNGLIYENDRKFYEGYVMYLLDHRDISSVSVQTYVRGLKIYLRWLYESGYVSNDKSIYLHMPKIEKRVIRVLSDREIELLCDSLDISSYTKIRNKVMIFLMLDSGLRLSEVVGLRMSDIFLDEMYIVVFGKGSKERFVPLSSEVCKLFRMYFLTLEREYPDNLSEFAFLKPTGDPVTVSTVKNVFVKLRHLTGIERLHPHLLRHTFATRYLENSGDVYMLKEILGHTNVKVTQQYIHLAKTYITRDFDRFSPLSKIKKNF